LFTLISSTSSLFFHITHSSLDLPSPQNANDNECEPYVDVRANFLVADGTFEGSTLLRTVLLMKNLGKLWRNLD
jgi:hypothetical protein